MRITNGYCIGLLGLALLLGGCASDDDPTQQLPNEQEHVDAPDPLGVYEDDYQSSHRIDAQTWATESGVFTFVDFDSKLDVAIAKNDAENPFFPGKYSRFDWAEDESGDLRYCQTVFDADTQADAAKAPRADESDWEVGCAGFAWSTLTGVAIVGSYTDQFGGGHVIDGKGWTMSGAVTAEFGFLELSNTERYVIAENATTNQYSPGKFSRFDWTVSTEGKVHFCQSTYGAETAEAARDAVAADAADLAKGCGGFGWSELTPNES